MVTGGAEGCGSGSGAAVGGCCAGEGCSTVGVSGSSEVELLSAADPVSAPVVVIRPTGNTLGTPVIARPASVAAVRWRCGCVTTTTGVA